MKRSLRAGLAAAMVLATPISFAANLVPNPDFTRLLTGWANGFPYSSANGEAVFTTGSPAMPSARIFSGVGPPGPASIVSLCMPASGLDSVTLGFNTRIVAGVVHGTVSAYSDAACATLIGSADTPEVTSAADWTPVATTFDGRFAGAESYTVSLEVDPPAGGTDIDAYFDHVAFGATETLPEAIPIVQVGLSGAWFNPDAVGQGVQFWMDPPDGLLFGTWYTYDTVAGGTDSQRWYTLVAAPSPDDITADVTIYRNTGGRFAAPPQTEAVPVGTGTLAFDSCMSGTFAYTLDDGRTGEIPLRTAVPMMYCSEIGTPDALAGQFVPPGPFGRGGAWYDPTTAGQGALVSVDYFGAVFVGWYTYEATGSASGPEGQRWFTAQGVINGGPIELGLYSTTGGVFDTGGGATTRQVGTGSLNFDTCEHATLDYTFTSGDLAGTHGTLDLARLGQTPQGCTPASP